MWLLFSIALGIDPAGVTVSGVSSGAAMALQLEISFSSTILGSALSAGPPYYCAQGSEGSVLACTQSPAQIPIPSLERAMQDFATSGAIDGLGNLTSHSVLLYSGTLDTVVLPGVVQASEQILRAMGVQTVQTEYSVASEHCWPTEAWGNQCPILGEPFINNCHYDLAGKALSLFYGPLKPSGSPSAGNIRLLDQNTFAPGGDAEAISMDHYAYAYMPSQCQGSMNNCKLHLSFHGCLQSSSHIGTDFVENAGFNAWAETNSIVVVYPQTLQGVTMLIKGGLKWRLLTT
uniref:Carboxylic ester hydrolase n=1 Tax=Arcella intermedia TaxID=1963864 RepID=A0A6B2LCV0_9EUKA